MSRSLLGGRAAASAELRVVGSGVERARGMVEISRSVERERILGFRGADEDDIIVVGAVERGCHVPLSRENRERFCGMVDGETVG